MWAFLLKTKCAGLLAIAKAAAGAQSLDLVWTSANQSSTLKEACGLKMQYHDREANMIKSKMFELLLTKYVVGNGTAGRVYVPPKATSR